MTEEDAAERRRFKRIDRSFITYYRRIGSVDDEDAALPLAGLARNVSIGGVLVDLDESVALGDRLSLELLLAMHEAPLNIIGRVVRLGQDGVGIEFERCDESDRERLTRFLGANGAT